jgi:hypothetical protein
MSMQRRSVLVGLSVFLFGLAVEPAVGQQPPKGAKFSHGLALQYRRANEENFKDGQSYGMEVFRDENNSNQILISETGSLSSMPKGTQATPPPKGAKFSHGLALPYRKAKEENFTPGQRYGVEIYRDENNGNLIYVSETGSVAALPMGTVIGTQAPKGAKFSHGLSMRYRKAREEGFTDDQRYGVEVYKDENNGNVIYISETGSICVLPGGMTASTPPKGAKFSHGLSLQVRRAKEEIFDDKTQRYGIEVYLDENNGNQVYLSETGSIAVLAGGTPALAPPKGARFSHGLSLQARKANEESFTDNTRRYGLESFRDENNNNLITISEIGTITVVSGK